MLEPKTSIGVSDAHRRHHHTAGWGTGRPGTLRHQTVRLFAVVVAVLAFGRLANADMVTLTLSNASSDSTPAEDLSATMAFSVSDSILTLTVTNNTPIIGGFGINAIYFNATSNVTDLSLNPAVSGWSLITPDDSSNILYRKAGGFGIFDYALIAGVKNNQRDHALMGGVKDVQRDSTLIADVKEHQDQIASQGTQIFTLDISGDTPFAAFDFTSVFSDTPPGRTPALAAIKFVNGPEDDDDDDDSAFGAVVPAPSAVMLGVLGFGLVVWVRRWAV